MPPGRRRRLLRQQQWGVNCLRRVPRRLAARALPRKRALRMLWRASQPGAFVAWGEARQAHAENARARLADDCRSYLPHATITFLAGTNGLPSLELQRDPIEHAERHSNDRIDRNSTRLNSSHLV